MADIDLAGLMGLSTVRQPLIFSGERGADLILEAMSMRNRQPNTEMLELELVIRSTTAAMKRKEAHKIQLQILGLAKQMTFKWTLQIQRCEGVPSCLQQAENAQHLWAHTETTTMVYHEFRRPLEWSITGVVISSLVLLATFTILGLGVWWSSVSKFSAHVVVSLILLAAVAAFRVCSYGMLFKPLYMFGSQLSGAIPFVFLR